MSMERNCYLRGCPTRLLGRLFRNRLLEGIRQFGVFPIKMVPHFYFSHEYALSLPLLLMPALFADKYEFHKGSIGGVGEGEVKYLPLVYTVRG